MKPRLIVLLLAMAGAASSALAQNPAPGPGRPGEDPLARFFFPPELVLQHIQELGLEPKQRITILAAVKEAQGDLFDLQIQMADRSQELLRMLRGNSGRVPAAGDQPDKVDEARVLAQVDRVLAVERDIKRRQMQLLIRLRNTLTVEQQETLTKYRNMPPVPGPHPDSEPF
jgi:hypothetical protein